MNSKDGIKHWFYRLKGNQWINIIKKVQMSFNKRALCLEIPTEIEIIIKILSRYCTIFVILAMSDGILLHFGSQAEAGK